MTDVETVEWREGRVSLIDQTRLPREELYLACDSVDAVADAIRSMRVRGAPAIGVTAAYGYVLGARQTDAPDLAAWLERLKPIAAQLRSTRPTAVNLFWAIERMERVAQAAASIDEARAALLAEAHRIKAEDIAANRAMGRAGADLIPDGAGVLTHCNAGALATAGYGTALGVIRAAHEQGKRLHVFVDETRPFLQGARLTAWELQRLGIPLTLISDNMAGYFFRQGQIQAVVTGADRIAANGDVANKIGTYTVAVLAREHGVPFYVAAPVSTLDVSLPNGDAIPIEERDPAEVTHFRGVPVAPEGIRAAHPAFDVTPYRYVAAIISERGVARAPYEPTLRAWAEASQEPVGVRTARE